MKILKINFFNHSFKVRHRLLQDFFQHFLNLKIMNNPNNKKMGKNINFSKNLLIRKFKTIMISDRKKRIKLRDHFEKLIN